MTQQVEQQQGEDTEQTQSNNQPAASAEETNQNTQAEPEASDQAPVAESGDGQARPRSRQSAPARYAYNPQAAVQTGLLHLATEWKDAGASYQAISAYTEILSNYPGTGVAAAATEGLLDLATRLEQEGRFYAALGIFRKLEALG